MYRLTTEDRIRIVQMLVEGNSIRATCRMTGISKQTVLTFILNFGRVCLNHDDRMICGLHIKQIECDEVWGFVHCKQRNVEKSRSTTERKGSAWTWYAVDRESKMILSWLMGDRDRTHALAFMQDLAGRLCSAPQLSTDSLGVYAGAVSEAFFGKGVDYGQIHKIYRASNSDPERQYSPSACVGCTKRTMRGNPDPAQIGTSIVERSNLTLRMTQRRWTRLTNAHSKSFKHMEAAFAIHAAHFNWCRKHATLGTTPAKAAGIADREWKIADLVALLEAEEQAAIEAGSLKRGSYKPRKPKSSN